MRVSKEGFGLVLVTSDLLSSASDLIVGALDSSALRLGEGELERAIPIPSSLFAGGLTGPSIDRAARRASNSSTSEL